MPLQLDLEVRTDNVLGLDAISDREIGKDRPRRRALLAADDPDFKAVFIKLFHKLHHV